MRPGLGNLAAADGSAGVAQETPSDDTQQAPRRRAKKKKAAANKTGSKPRKEKKNAVDSHNGLKDSNGEVKGRKNVGISNGTVPKKVVNGNARKSS